MTTHNVKDFGAIGDGIADDVASIQEAIDKAQAGDTVYVPVGTYKISTSIRMREDVHFRSDPGNAFDCGGGTFLELP
jgi:polygalacturonase